MVQKIILFICLGVQINCYSQYVTETNPVIVEKIKQWQDLKFGLLMHWGPYSQWGIIESWTLCPEEYHWCNRTAGSNPDNYVEYTKEYEGLKNTFNPVSFDPKKWAVAAKNAGMKYVVFTTKHHDGFCMYDSKYTDYKITDTSCPYSVNERSNITKEIFDAFRKEDFWTGLYFSKPDWHSPYYWDPIYPARDRNVNYEPESNPEKWNSFIEFTHNQIIELLTDYGKIDILWLDGGWVAKKQKNQITSWYDQKLIESENGYLKNRNVNQDIHMDELVIKARQKQPSLIVVDRSVYGKNQNYLTPENSVPENVIHDPWESCITSTGRWSHLVNAEYMSGHVGLHVLVDVVAKGGNLLLNIAPTPEGEFQPGAHELLEEFGKWMSINKEGIYNSKVLAPHKEANLCMTQQTNGNAFFFYLCKENEVTMPSEIIIKSHQPAEGSKVNLLGYEIPLKWAKFENGVKVFIPKAIRKNPPCNHIWTIKVSKLIEK